jgi:site-specific recombinase XerD
MSVTPRPTPPTNKGRRFPAEPLDPAEVVQLLSAASTRSPSGLRMRAMVAVMYGAGLRLSETLALFPRDINATRREVRVRQGKGRKARPVTIDAGSCAHVERWLDARKRLGLTGWHPIFAQYTTGKVGQPLDPRYVRAALTRLGRRAGIEKRVHPHGLRHSLATWLDLHGTPLAVSAAQLGHASTAYTDTYLRKLSASQLHDAMTGLDPYAG